MEIKLILRGALSGAVAGLLAFVFARLFAEPQIQAAIDYESGRDAAQEALDKAAGLTVDAMGHDIFSRAIQADVGLGVGLVVFGAALGALFAVVYAVCLGRVGGLTPRTLALLLAGGGFTSLYFVPFLKYPANPPAIGHEDTIRERSLLYLTMVLCSLALLVAAVLLGRRLADRYGNFNASLIVGVGYLAAIGLLMGLLSALGHLHANVEAYGRHGSETPLPLTDPNGNIVFPGFPADTLYYFRFYSIVAQLLLWGGIGLIFGTFAERLLRTPAGAGSAAPADRDPVSV